MLFHDLISNHLIRFFSLLHSNLQLPVTNMPGVGPGDWGNCTDPGKE